MKIFLKIILIIICAQCSTDYIFSQEPNGKYTIVIHGGAGYMNPDIPESSKQAYLSSLTNALNIGKEIFQVEDGISYNLSGTVIGNIAATVDLVKASVNFPELLFIDE